MYDTGENSGRQRWNRPGQKYKSKKILDFALQ